MKIAGEIIHIPGIAKALAICILVMLLINIKNGCADDVSLEQQTLVVQTKKIKRHALVIYEIKTMPEGNRFKYEYITDNMSFWSTSIYSIDDTLSFTTRKIKQEFTDLKNENVRLKAEITRRDKAWKSIKKNIQKELYSYE